MIKAGEKGTKVPPVSVAAGEKGSCCCWKKKVVAAGEKAPVIISAGEKSKQKWVNLVLLSINP